MLARLVRWLAALAFVALVSAAARAQFLGERLVDPFEVRSPDGTWSLFVDPSTPAGEGPAKYRLSRGKDVAWSGELACTLRDLQLGDDGAFAGTSRASDGLRLMLVGADGKPRFDKTLPNEGEWIDGPSFPGSSGVVAASDLDRVLFRVAHLDRDRNDAVEQWHAVSWSTGEPDPLVQPELPFGSEGGICRLNALRPIAGLPLLACSWSRFTHESDRRVQGAGFCLAGLDGKPVWSLVLPHDYEAGGDKQRQDRLWDWIRDHGAVLECATPQRFELFFAAEAQRVTFEATADAKAPKGWNVREVSRAPDAIDYDQRWRPEPPAALPKLSLQFLGAVELQAGKQVASRFNGFDIDDRGRLGRVLWTKDGPARFELREPSGAVVVDAALDLTEAQRASLPQATWLRGDRWLLTNSTYEGKEQRLFAWWLDLPTAALTAIPDFDCAPIEKADGTFDGGFVALTAKHLEYTIETTLSSFDAQGKLRWRDTQAYGQSDDGLFSAEDVRVSPKGEIGVLDNIRHSIQRFGMDGKLVSEIELDEVLGQELGYPTELGVDPDGNWIVCDTPDAVPVLRVTRDGKLSSTFTPHFADGRTFEPRDPILVAPDGRMWTTDGHAYLRLDDTGAVDLIVGDAPDETSLGEIECAFVDPLGRTLLADGRTHSVHVFDREGKRIALCRFAPADLSERTEVQCLATSADGRIHVGLGDWRVSEYRAFDAAGNRLGPEDSKGRVLFQPGRPERWELAYDEIRLCDAAGAAKKRLLRSQDNRWLSGAEDGSVAPDGSLAVIARGKLHVWSPTGEPVLSIDLPAGSGGMPAFADTRVFLCGGDQVCCVDLVSRTVRKATLGRELTADASTVACWRADVGELWILDLEARRVLRYQVKQ